MTGGVANAPDLVDKLVKLAQSNGVNSLITNLDAELYHFTLGDRSFPISVSSGQTCYICSPSVAYIDYALEETRNFENQPILYKVMRTLISACRPLIRATGLDHQVQPNNWLFSTNPVPDLSNHNAENIRNTLIQNHPDRAIVIRSLNERADKSSIIALRKAGFQMLPARQIYLFDAKGGQKPSVDMKRDAKLLKDTDYQIVPAQDFSVTDFSRAAKLYGMLYLDKYTPLNPDYTASFLAQAHQIGLLRLLGLRGPDDQLDGIIGMFENGRTLTVPIIGYDTSKPQQTGLYRLLNAIGQKHAIEGKKFYNLSAGAAAFKRHRRADPVIEYTAVYVAHLGLPARLATKLVRVLLTMIGIPLLKRFEL